MKKNAASRGQKKYSLVRMVVCKKRNSLFIKINRDSLVVDRELIQNWMVVAAEPQDSTQVLESKAPSEENWGGKTNKNLEGPYETLRPHYKRGTFEIVTQFKAFRGGSIMTEGVVWKRNEEIPFERGVWGQA